jgi:alkylated DNA repair protein (DNA oxidative demethylase)
MRARPAIRGLYYDRSFVSKAARAEVLQWLSTIHPIWENRFSEHNPPPEGKEQRKLLRPVYWLGNWQFACLDYYHPPKGVENRCVQAEAFPPVLQRMVDKIEGISRNIFRGPDLPPKWHLNTCLVNLYGSRLENGKKVDTARVGEHKDFEPGPVASISLGERAMFQFVSSKRPGTRDAVVCQQWLDDCSLQIFGGERLKRHLFHRVQRVDKRDGHGFKLNVQDFETRRINFTFRYVPDEHVVPYSKLPRNAASDVREYMEELARNSAFFKSQLEESGT